MTHIVHRIPTDNGTPRARDPRHAYLECIRVPIGMNCASRSTHTKYAWPRTHGRTRHRASVVLYAAWLALPAAPPSNPAIALDSDIDPTFKMDSVSRELLDKNALGHKSENVVRNSNLQLNLCSAIADAELCNLRPPPVAPVAYVTDAPTMARRDTRPTRRRFHEKSFMKISVISSEIRIGIDRAACPRVRRRSRHPTAGRSRQTVAAPTTNSIPLYSPFIIAGIIIDPFHFDKRDLRTGHAVFCPAELQKTINNGHSSSFALLVETPPRRRPQSRTVTADRPRVIAGAHRAGPRAPNASITDGRLSRALNITGHANRAIRSTNEVFGLHIRLAADVDANSGTSAPMWVVAERSQRMCRIGRDLAVDINTIFLLQKRAIRALTAISVPPHKPALRISFTLASEYRFWRVEAIVLVLQWPSLTTEKCFEVRSQKERSVIREKLELDAC
ncbi:hypothetical protein EVAR_5418_1 [Eumeta japonica]|uniref:Uncharacterized protein n=1 Tax=Eumeta variegata TaxID=151549 RepID=A0A4C1T8J4_EUMVA|nr:hypothetical protein EVAR_5418_1 [Eumeta japonica]